MIYLKSTKPKKVYIVSLISECTHAHTHTVKQKEKKEKKKTLHIEILKTSFPRKLKQLKT